MAPFAESRNFRGWWVSKTPLEQKLIILSSVLFILSFCLTISVIVLDNRKPPASGSTTTLEPSTNGTNTTTASSTPSNVTTASSTPSNVTTASSTPSNVTTASTASMESKAGDTTIKPPEKKQERADSGHISEAAAANATLEVLMESSPDEAPSSRQV